MGRIIGHLIVGLIGVVITGAVAVYGFDRAKEIESDLQGKAAAKLKETGPAWATVKVNGRDAILSGKALLEPERKAAADKASDGIDAISGIREVRDNTSAQFKSMAALQQALGEACKTAAEGLPGSWLKCAVQGKTVTLTGAAMTETERKNGVEKVSAAVEAMKAQEKISDKTTAHYKSLEAMRSAFDGACDKAIAGFTLNWLKCAADGRKFTLSGEAPVESERKDRVEKAKAVLQGIKGVEGVADQTKALPAFETEDACQKFIDDLKKGKTIRFAVGKATIDAKSHVLLDSLTIAAKRCVGLKIEIQGHTDNTGDAEANQKLSEARAQSVVAYLTKRGVSADRITSKGYGDSKPVASNDTEEGKAKNRRIDFDVSK